MNEEENSKIYKAETKENISITPGNLQRLPDESLSEKTLVFVDEGFLNELSKYFGSGKYLKFDEKNWVKYSKFIKNTLSFYEEQHNQGKKPFLFHLTPHILYKGSINVKNCEVIQT